jgi:[protein-PII] uridylyltransferase
MKTAASTPYKDAYENESAEIRRRFELAPENDSPGNGSGHAAAKARAALVDRIVTGLFQEHIGNPEGFAMIALGGYGRAVLFPCSDIDLLFLSTDSTVEALHKAALSVLTQNLWDMRLKLGQTSRTPAECGRLHRDNLEFNVGLLDARFLAGDQRLFTHLKRTVLPPFLRSNGAELANSLGAMTRKRHARHGNTIFHLEPNLKESPGGLRDYNVAQWIAQISWQPPTAQEENAAPAMERAFDFLASARCLLHYRLERDDNRLTYEIQVEAARHEPVEEWMRKYFRHARAIYRHTCAMLDRSVEQTRGRGSLLGMYQDWRSRLSTADFAVVKDRIYVRQPGALEDPTLLLGLFEQVARHGLVLSGEAEVAVERALDDLRPRGEGNALLFAGLWRRLKPILTLLHAAEALRSMHSLHLLSALFPEFAAVDCLVVRDFYHRYTVDEHTFQTIAALRALPAAEGQWEHLFAEILSELEQPELLSLALLLHDIGKGMGAEHHVQGSLSAAESVFARLSLDQADRASVRFLIKSHLEMSATLQRRDIFDPETARALAELAGTPERLKMLTLLTYADIRAVNPEALTPWKAEMLWRLYAAASGYLTRSVDDDRIPAPAPQASDDGSGFLAGFPRRYQAIHTADEIAMHAEMARDLAQHPVQVRVMQRGHGWEITVVTADKPRLFASVTGVLAAWGMSIQKADAFSNAAGIVLDVFRFADLYRTLELNPSEVDRLRRDVVRVLHGKLDLALLMSGRERPTAPPPKVHINTQIRFDQSSSSHSTLLEIVTGDRPGLLYDISSKLAEAGCNIEVALIDTEGHKAIDVFYLTKNGAKLEPASERALREKLQN